MIEGKTAFDEWLHQGSFKAILQEHRKSPLLPRNAGAEAVSAEKVEYIRTIQGIDFQPQTCRKIDLKRGADREFIAAYCGSEGIERRRFYDVSKRGAANNTYRK